MTLELDNVPFWNQLDDTHTADHRAPEDPANDCGEECACIVMYHVTGVERAADDVHDEILGEGVTNQWTTSYQLAAYLTRWASIPCAVHTGLSPVEVQRTVKSSIDDKRLCIVLTRFNVNDPASGHWVVACGYDDAQNAMIAADPWGGRRRLIPWQSAWFKGDVVEVRRRRCLDVVA